MSQIKFTKKQFDTLFADDEVCLDYLFQKKYKDAHECTACKKTFKYYRIRTRKVYSCQYCGHDISPTANTIFHKSSTSLKDWFYAIYLFSISKNGVSAKELQRQLGVTYKTAWRMAHHIRKLCNSDIQLLNGIVEIDETYVGGKESNKHADKKVLNAQGRSIKTKTPILGAIERKGNIVAKVVINVKSSTIQPFLREHIDITAEIKTDEFRAYASLSTIGYCHETIDHGKKEYVRGEVHTNNVEGFWSQLKRSINGTYHFVSPKYLQQYVNEFAYRYNHRNSDIPLFNHLLVKIV